MTFDLDNFEEQFNEQLLKKGLILYKSKQTEITKEVGSILIKQKHKSFNIAIKRSGKKVKAVCSCNKLICEHVAAALFFLNKNKIDLPIKAVKTAKTINKKDKTSLSITELLSHLNQSELLSILNEVALKYENINVQLRARFASLNNHSVEELLELNIQNLLYNNYELKSDSKENHQLFIQNIYKLRNKFSHYPKVNFFADSALILLKIYSKLKKTWLKELIVNYCNETFAKIEINDLKSFQTLIEELIIKFEIALKPEQDRLFSRFYIKCFWVTSPAFLSERLNVLESYSRKLIHVWPETKLNIAILRFMLDSKKNGIILIKKTDEYTNAIASMIALLEFEPVKAKKYLQEIIVKSSYEIFSNYSVSSRIYMLLKENSLDVPLKVFLINAFKTEGRFSDEYLNEFDRLSKNDIQKLSELTSIIEFWLSIKNSTNTIQLLELAIRYQLVDCIKKILKTNRIPMLSFKDLLINYNFFNFKELEELFIDSIIRKMNGSESIRSQENAFNEINQIINQLNDINPTLFYKKLHQRRLLNNHFFDLVEKEFNVV